MTFPPVVRTYFRITHQTSYMLLLSKVFFPPTIDSYSFFPPRVCHVAMSIKIVFVACKSSYCPNFWSLVILVLICLIWAMKWVWLFANPQSAASFFLFNLNLKQNFLFGYFWQLKLRLGLGWSFECGEESHRIKQGRSQKQLQCSCTAWTYEYCIAQIAMNVWPKGGSYLPTCEFSHSSP